MIQRLATCRCCGGTDLVPYLDLGDQPLANAFHKGESSLPRFPLAVQVCTACWHSQLVEAVDPDVLFRDYLYVSGTTHTFRRHCEELAASARRLVRCAPHPRVLDIACNDGTLLECFRDLGCDVQGVDPALSLRPITKEKDLPVETEFWSTAVASRLGRFDLVTATNVLGHVTDPLAFLVACRSVLTPHGRLVVEFPYVAETLRRCEFDQIYHEHVSYFLVQSFATLAERAHLRVADVILTEIHGGSIRFVLERGFGPHADVARELACAESAMGLHDVALYREFEDRVARTGDQLVSTLDRTIQDGRKVVAYGASAKGNTLLNHFDIDVAYVVDDNSRKWGLLTPGRNVPVRAPSELIDEPGRLAIVVLAWNFLDEIRQRIAALRGPLADDVCIVHVPQVRIVAVAA